MAVVGSAYVVIRALTDKLKSDIQSSLNSSGDVGSQLGERIGKNMHESFARETSGLGDNIDLSHVKNQIGTELSDGARDGARAAEAEIEKIDLETPARKAGGRGGRGLGNEFAAGLSGSGAGGALQGLILRIGALVPIIAIAVGALSSLVSGLFALSAAVAPAVNALAVLPGVLGAVVQGIGGFALAFGGIGAAFKAGSKATAGAGAAAGRSAKSIASAQKRVADAARQNQDATEQAARAVRDAQRGLSDAYEKASERAVRATRDLYNAQRDLASAQRDAAQAQQDVNQARIDAAESLQQLGFSTRGAAIDEKQALIALQRARENLARFLELPVDNRLRQEAQLAADEAQLNYERATDKAGDLKKSNEAAQKAGIDGSSEVIQAKQREADAQQKLLDATLNLQDAQQGLAKTQRDNARDIADAQERLNDALKAQKRTAEDNARRMADALQSVTDAASGAGGGVNAYNQALKNLSPEAQHFVKFMLGIRDSFRQVRNEAGKDLFPRLEIALTRLIKGGFLDDLGKGLRESGRIMGDFAIDLSNLLNNPFFRGVFRDAMKSNNKVLEDITKSVTPLIGALVALTAAAAPVTEEFARWIRIKAEAIAGYTGVGKSATEAADKQKHLAGVIRDGADVAKQLGHIFGNVGSALFHLGQTARPAGQQLLDAFERVTKQWRDFAKNPENGTALSDYFQGVADNVRAIGRLAQSLGRSFARLGDDPSIKRVADILTTEVVPTIEDIIANVNEKLGPQLAQTFDAVLEAFQSLSDSPAFQIVLGIFKAFADAIKALATNPFTRPALFALLSFLAAMKSIQLIGDFIGLKKMVGYYKTLKGVLGGKKLAADAAAAAAAGSAGGGGGAAAAGAAGRAAGGTAAVGATAGKAAKDVGKLRGALNGLIPGFALLTGPIALIIAAVVALVAIFIGAYKNSEKLQKVFRRIGAALSPLLKKFKEFVGNVLEKLGDLLADVITWMIELGIKAMPYVKKGIDKIQEGFKKAQPFLEKVGEVLKVIGTFIVTKAVPAYIAFEKALFKVYITIISKVIGALIKIITTIVRVVIEIVKFGIKVYGVFRDVSEWISKKVNDIVSFVGSIGSRIGAFVGTMFSTIKTAILNARNYVRDRIADVISFVRGIAARVRSGIGNAFGAIVDKIISARNYVRDRINDVISFVRGIGSRVRSGLGNAFGAIADKIRAARDYVRDRITDVVGSISGMKSRISRAARGMWDGIKDAFKGAINAIIGWWNGLEFTIPAIKIAGKSVSPAVHIGTPNIPRLAAGGTVDPKPGGTLALLAEAGRRERVTPLGPDGLSRGERAILSSLQGRGGAGANIVIHVYPSADMDEAALAGMIDRRIAWTLRS